MPEDRLHQINRGFADNASKETSRRTSGRYGLSPSAKSS
jgi:hypothetical protein